MTSIYTIAGLIGLGWAGINLSEIIRDPRTKGWGIGLGLLTFATCCVMLWRQS